MIPIVLLNFASHAYFLVQVLICLSDLEGAKPSDISISYYEKLFSESYFCCALLSEGIGNQTYFCEVHAS